MRGTRTQDFTSTYQHWNVSLMFLLSTNADNFSRYYSTNWIRASSCKRKSSTTNQKECHQHQCVTFQNIKWLRPPIVEYLHNGYEFLRPVFISASYLATLDCFVPPQERLRLQSWWQHSAPENPIEKRYSMGDKSNQLVRGAPTIVYRIYNLY